MGLPDDCRGEWPSGRYPAHDVFLLCAAGVNPQQVCRSTVFPEERMPILSAYTHPCWPHFATMRKRSITPMLPSPLRSCAGLNPASPVRTPNALLRTTRSPTPIAPSLLTSSATGTHAAAAVKVLESGLPTIAWLMLAKYPRMVCCPGATLVKA